MRITGIATGLDIDEVVKSTMKAYRVKIDQTTQKKDVVEIKQKLYKDIMSEASNFYDKYFDITKGDSLLKTSNYKAIQFKSSNSNVVVTGSSEAKVNNYKITGSIATAQTATIKEENIKAGNGIIINDTEFTLRGSTKSEIAKNLDKDLKNAGINISASWTNFGTNGLLLQSDKVGTAGKFTVSLSDTSSTTVPNVKQTVLSGGENAKPATYTVQESDISNNGNSITINTKRIQFQEWQNIDDRIKVINKELDQNGIVALNVDGNIQLRSLETGKNAGITVNGKEVAKGEDAKPSITTINKEVIEVNGQNIDLRKVTTKDDINNKLEGTGLIGKILSDGKIELATKETGANTSCIILVKNNLQGTYAPGNDETKAKHILTNKDIAINGVKVDLSSLKSKDGIDEDKVKELNEKLKDVHTIAKVNGDDIIIESTIPGENGKIQVNQKDENQQDKEVLIQGENAKGATLSDLSSGTYKINEIEIDLTYLKTNDEIVSDEEEKKISDGIGKTNEKLKSIGLTAELSLDKKTINITSNKPNQLIDVYKSAAEEKIPTEKDKTESEIKSTNNTLIIIEEAKDSTVKIENIKTNQIYEVPSDSNTATLDGVTFKFNGPIDGSVNITGEVNATDTKNKIVSFINDYNDLIKKLNTLIGTKHPSGYDPLTADQKKEMSETEIKLWNEKVETGRLYRDSNLTRITNSLKSTMRTVMSGSGMNLEKIGISPVRDYAGSLNGTFSIDEDKLTNALQDNIEEVVELFTANPSSDSIDKNSYTSKKGIMYQLKDILYDEFKSSSSMLAKKAGITGTATASSNELSNSIKNYENKIKDMETAFSKKEQALYSKYANLETMMNKLNSQQSYLSSQLG